MDGPAHYREAESALAQADNSDYGDVRETYWLARAQVHATLALAAATALGPHEYPTYSRSDQSGWFEAAGSG